MSLVFLWWLIGVFVGIGFLLQQLADAGYEPTWSDLILGILLLLMWPLPAAVLLGIWLARRFNACG